MADIKISALAGGGAAQAADEYVVARGGTNVKITGANVAAAATTVGTLTGLTTSGPVLLPSGSAAAPALAFSGDVNTGVYAAAADTLAFATGGTERARIDASGNVGIGTTAPSNGLQVAAGGAASAGISVTGNNSPRITLTETTGGVISGLYIDASSASIGTATNHPYILWQNATERARFNTSGNYIPGANNAYSLGDGTTRWTEVFAINGTINTSDANAKTDVQEDVPGTEFVRALRPVHYRWKVRKHEVVTIPAEVDAEGNEIAPARTETIAHEGVRRHLGFIAQEVKAALGDRDFGLFTQDAETGEMGLRYDQFAPVFAKVLQEQDARIEALEARLAALEAK